MIRESTQLIARKLGSRPAFPNDMVLGAGMLGWARLLRCNECGARDAAPAPASLGSRVRLPLKPSPRARLERQATRRCDRARHCRKAARLSADSAKAALTPSGRRRRPR